MSSFKEDQQNARKQAFFDSRDSYKINIDKYKNTSDPILQQKERYVINIYFIFILLYNRKQKNTNLMSKQIIISII